MKVFLVDENVMTAVVNFIGAKHTYVEAKPFIDALQGSKTAEVTEASPQVPNKPELVKEDKQIDKPDKEVEKNTI